MMLIFTDVTFLSADSELGPSVVVHTSVPFSLEHLEEDKNAIVPTILQHLRDVLPELPEPTEIKGHKWRFSQVTVLRCFYEAWWQVTG